MKNTKSLMKLKIILSCGLILIMFLFLGCFSVKPVYNTEEKKLAKNATKKFHQLYRKNRFVELYDLTDETARVTKKKEDFLKLVEFVYLNNGENKHSNIVDSKVIPHASFSEVHLLYKTKFENSEQYEQFVWYVDDGKTGLFSYSITNMTSFQMEKEH